MINLYNQGQMDAGVSEKGQGFYLCLNGAPLYLDGCSWNKQQGFSLRLDGDSVRLDGNLLSRSAIYDMTLTHITVA